MRRRHQTSHLDFDYSLLRTRGSGVRISPGALYFSMTCGWSPSVGLPQCSDFCIATITTAGCQKTPVPGLVSFWPPNGKNQVSSAVKCGAATAGVLDVTAGLSSVADHENRKRSRITEFVIGMSRSSIVLQPGFVPRAVPGNLRSLPTNIHLWGVKTEILRHVESGTYAAAEDRISGHPS
jgi:hypothetical protein